ncbi:MAG: hypothetical protein E7302_07535 [Butyrivibrio sp.]|nr:hypothetical protein [Butyrivibrio sp.]
MKKIPALLLVTICVFSNIFVGCSNIASTKKPKELKELASENASAENESVFDLLITAYTSLDEFKKTLSSNGIQYTEEDGGIFSTTIVPFDEYDSSFEVYYSDNTIYEAYSYLYFKDESSFDSAKEKLSSYLSSKMHAAEDPAVSEIVIDEVTYYPVTVFNSEEAEKMVLYITLSEAEYDEMPSQEYISKGYEISENTISYDDWILIISDEAGDENDEE